MYLQSKLAINTTGAKLLKRLALILCLFLNLHAKKNQVIKRGRFLTTTCTTKIVFYNFLICIIIQRKRFVFLNTY